MPGAPPKHGRVPLSPPIDLMAVPRQRPIAEVPNPRRPKVVRVDRRELLDLFAVFPDLPRPARPQSRLATRVISLRRRYL